LFASYHSGYAISIYIYIAACAVVSLVATAMMHITAIIIFPREGSNETAPLFL
jgi:hypothetical protein